MSDKRAPLSVITVWGESGVGKTMFGILSPYKPVLVLDTERSSQPYKYGPLGKEFERKDCLTWMGPGGLKEALKAIKPGEYGTVVIDTGTQFCDWVARETFQRAGARAQKQSMIVWGEAKQAVKQYILELMQKVQVVVITAHARNRYGDHNGAKEARVLEPIYELSDLFMELRREPNQRIPYGLTMPPTSKSRIMALPPKIPQATWETILRYIQETPADWENLAPEESVPEELLYPGLEEEE
jgi:hypothetical protein